MLGIVITTDGTVRHAEIDGFARIGSEIGCQWIQSVTAVRPAGRVPGVSMYCDEEGPWKPGACLNPLARTVLAALMGVPESSLQQFAGDVMFLGLTRRQYVSLSETAIRQIESVVSRRSRQ